MLILISKTLGFGREMIMAFYYGTTDYTDVYTMCLYIPNILFGGIISSAIAIIPIYKDVQNRFSKIKATKLLNTMITYIVIITIVFVPLYFTSLGPIVDIMAPGFDGEKKTTEVLFIHYSIYYVCFAALAEMMVSYLNCNDIFVSAKAANLMVPIIQIICIYLSVEYNILFLPLGLSLSYMLYFVMVYIIAKRNEYDFCFTFRMDDNVKKALQLIFPVMVSSMIVFVNTYIDKYFASGMESGKVAALNYASLMYEAVFTVGSTAIVTVIYPKIAESVAIKEYDNAKKLMKKACRSMELVFLPVMITVLVFSHELIQIVFQRGAFNNESTLLTASALGMYCIGLIPRAESEIKIRALYSLNRNYVVTLIGAGAVLLNIILDLFFKDWFGHYGLALATSITSFLSYPIFNYFVNKMVGNSECKKMYIWYSKLCFSGACYWACSMLGKNIFVKTGDIIMDTVYTVLILLVSVVVYFIILRMFRMIDVTNMLPLKRQL